MDHKSNSPLHTWINIYIIDINNQMCKYILNFGLKKNKNGKELKSYSQMQCFD